MMMRVLVVTNMYPTQDMPNFGLFVKEQIDLIKEQDVDVDVLFINGKKKSLNYIWAIFRLWLCGELEFSWEYWPSSC